MARAMGARVRLLGQFESVYGTAPSGDFIKLPFVSVDAGSEQGLIESDLLGLGRDPSAPSRGVINVDGPLVVPVDLRNFGHWLKLVFGDPVTTGTGPYTHTFVSGGTNLPSMALEVGHPEVPTYRMLTGVLGESLSLTWSREGHANAELSLIGQNEAPSGVSGGGTPTEAALTRFNQFQGSIERDAAALANVTGGRLTYANNFERVETIRTDGLIGGADPSVASLTGSIDVRFADTALLDAATAGTASELEFGYVIDNDNQLTITVHEVYLPKPKVAVQGPGGVAVSFDWQAALDTAAGQMVTLELVNDVATY